MHGVSSIDDIPDQDPLDILDNIPAFSQAESRHELETDTHITAPSPSPTPIARDADDESRPFHNSASYEPASNPFLCPNIANHRGEWETWDDPGDEPPLQHSDGTVIDSARREGIGEFNGLGSHRRHPQATLDEIDATPQSHDKDFHNRKPVGVDNIGSEWEGQKFPNFEDLAPQLDTGFPDSTSSDSLYPHPPQELTTLRTSPPSPKTENLDLERIPPSDIRTAQSGDKEDNSLPKGAKKLFGSACKSLANSGNGNLGKEISPVDISSSPNHVSSSLEVVGILLHIRKLPVEVRAMIFREYTKDWGNLNILYIRHQSAQIKGFEDTELPPLELHFKKCERSEDLYAEYYKNRLEMSVLEFFPAFRKHPVKKRWHVGYSEVDDIKSDLRYAKNICFIVW